jgi:hypothetical protein
MPAPAHLSAYAGYDISWPQCGGVLPAHPYGFGIIGITGGKAFTTNPCLGDQVEWAGAGGSGSGAYVNLNSPTDGSDPYDYGVRAIRDAVAYADGQRIHPPMWWLDVETDNAWSPDLGANSRVIQGAIAELHRNREGVGIYSTGYQWGVIAGDYAPAVPVWLAGAPDVATAATWCSQPGFGGGQVWMVQALVGQFDNDFACFPVSAKPDAVFSMTRPQKAPVITRTWHGLS